MSLALSQLLASGEQENKKKRHPRHEAPLSSCSLSRPNASLAILVPVTTGLFPPVLWTLALLPVEEDLFFSSNILKTAILCDPHQVSSARKSALTSQFNFPSGNTCSYFPVPGVIPGSSFPDSHHCLRQIFWSYPLPTKQNTGEYRLNGIRKQWMFPYPPLYIPL